MRTSDQAPCLASEYDIALPNHVLSRRPHVRRMCQLYVISHQLTRKRLSAQLCSCITLPHSRTTLLMYNQPYLTAAQLCSCITLPHSRTTLLMYNQPYLTAAQLCPCITLPHRMEQWQQLRARQQTTVKHLRLIGTQIRIRFHQDETPDICQRYRCFTITAFSAASYN
ncbi:hypothetical protein Bbelb_299390 [Branchiostoma belcheri]|nr:hypothetical protein Bbelb_299390 [Branchiostoma belcheri]